ncbi:hypothetical protein ADU18_0256 [Cronobacter phage PBES 02]|uniref:Uncharacterized protein n=1 Tax=Cronobacter phage PBES 02 TaxID=1684115 RepID=A0A0K1YAL5_9CAUD|nr:hypothetical protein ADU18_0256 [Cronobacter phage PBES 02]AKY04150.1 hypothetical protein ADU18_0256 [Cronobacter phage PBES 02]
MAKVTYKKSRGVSSVNLAAVVTLPAYRTRDEARAVASKIRAAGVTPTTPTKTADGWRVTAKHSGGTLSRNTHR